MIVPGYVYEDIGPNGAPYDEMAHPKVCIHTTEGTSLAGAEVAFAQFPPHLGYDPRTREKKQYVPLDLHAYAFLGAENDDEYVIQVEIVGFARETHLWSEQIYRNIAEDVVRPLQQAINVPSNYRRFYREGEDGLILASPNSPIRMSDSEFRAFSGWFGHQHAPKPDAHWDPGGFLMDFVLQLALPPVIPERIEENMFVSVTLGSIGQPNFKSAVRFPDGTSVDLTNDSRAINSVQAALNAGLVTKITCETQSAFDSICQFGA